MILTGDSKRIGNEVSPSSQRSAQLLTKAAEKLLKLAMMRGNINPANAASDDELIAAVGLDNKSVEVLLEDEFSTVLWAVKNNQEGPDA